MVPSAVTSPAPANATSHATTSPPEISPAVDPRCSGATAFSRPNSAIPLMIWVATTTIAVSPSTTAGLART